MQFGHRFAAVVPNVLSQRFQALLERYQFILLVFKRRRAIFGIYNEVAIARADVVERFRNV